MGEGAVVPASALGGLVRQQAPGHSTRHGASALQTGGRYGILSVRRAFLRDRGLRV